ncbi:MAG: NAD-dependent epimerase/dehydratase family protein [Neisseria sp.]|nr:NAD-dependent epimerase/dehydratase family protein [Neisseria sp.]
MNILLLGGSGFIGARIAAALRANGHQVNTPRSRDIDYLHPNEQTLQAALQGQEVVINAVGLMHYKQDVLEMVHHHAVRIIATAAKAQGVRLFVQLSALGADAAHKVAFVGSKGRGDAALLALADEHFHVQIARPSVVYGVGGASSRAFAQAARLPMLMLPERGEQRVQPVHVADVAAGFVRMVEAPLPSGSIVNMAGGEAMTLAQYLSVLREILWHKPPLKVVRVPDALVRMATLLLEKPSKGLISAGNLSLLKAGNCADTQAFAALLGREPLRPHEFAERA